ncbi:probable G-protein coupled receptor 139 [Narcine bancroftii]|uniref:probable G-protein coupled receptor 139 n=1 Tax=Narcine bancroftii TaxID=1343680 RepID=UPI003831062E
MLSAFYRFRRIVYIFIAVLGIPANVVALAVLSQGRCGLSTCTTRYLVSMAAADQLIILINVVLWRFSYYYFPSVFLHITPVCSLISVLGRVVTGCSVWFTVTFTFDRFVAICFPKLKTKFCTGKTASAVLTTTSVLLSLQRIPYYFTYEPLRVVGNVPWFCMQKASYFTNPGWVAFDWANTLITPLIPFALILFFNALTVRHVVLTSRVRRGLRRQRGGGSRSDPEMESRRRSMILLFAISGSFILLWSVHVVHFLYYTTSEANPNHHNDSEIIFLQVGQLLLTLSCCTNTFIYALTQSKFREHLVDAVTFPITSVIHLICRPDAGSLKNQLKVFPIQIQRPP